MLSKSLRISELKLDYDNGAVRLVAFDSSGYPIPPEDVATYLNSKIDSVHSINSSGASVSLPDSLTAGVFSVVLTANCSITLPDPIVGGNFVLVLTQDTTGSRTVSFSEVSWAGGVAPTLSTDPSSVDIFTFICVDGVKWLGFTAGLDMRV